MTRRIFNSIFIVAIIVFLAALTLTMGALYSYFSSEHQLQIRTQTQMVAKGVSDEGEVYLDGLDAGGYRVTWIDSEGDVIYDNESNPEKMGNHSNREEVREAFAKGYGASDRMSKTLTEKQVYSAQKLPDGTVIRLAGAHYTIWTLLREILIPLILIILAAAGLAIFMASRLSKKIIEPISEAGIHTAVKSKGYEELKPLLEESEQMRREFTANVSHEMKTPLQSISGYAELLKNGVVKSDKVEEFSGRIYAESQRMINLVEDVLELSHLDEGATEMKKVRLDLFDEAQKVCDQLMQEAEAADVTLKLTGESTVIEGYPQLAYLIVHNLCENGIKYNVPGGTVEIDVQKQSGTAVLTVKDTGVGIPQDQQERVFERFYRVDKSRSKEVGGTGLGLSIVKHAVKMHGGEISLTSAPGKGTTVTVKMIR